MKKLALVMMGLSSIQAMAGYQLASNGKTVTCYAEDNQSFVLNAKRTTVKYVVEGESLGPKKIKSVKTDKATYISYVTTEGTLTLSNKGDFYVFDGETDGGQVSCK